MGVPSAVGQGRRKSVPLFHLNVFDSAGDALDEEGQELADLEAAHAEAIRGIRSLLGSELSEGRMDLAGRIEIADDDGRLLQTIAFRDAVKIVG
jgi:hypothetical protein